MLGHANPASASARAEVYAKGADEHSQERGHEHGADMDDVLDPEIEDNGNNGKSEYSDNNGNNGKKGREITSDSIVSVSAASQVSAIRSRSPTPTHQHVNVNAVPDEQAYTDEVSTFTNHRVSIILGRC